MLILYYHLHITDIVFIIAKNVFDMVKEKTNIDIDYKVKARRTTVSKIKVGKLGLELIVKPKIKKV